MGQASRRMYSRMSLECKPPCHSPLTSGHAGSEPQKADLNPQKEALADFAWVTGATEHRKAAKRRFPAEEPESEEIKVERGRFESATVGERLPPQISAVSTSCLLNWLSYGCPALRRMMLTLDENVGLPSGCERRLFDLKAQLVGFPSFTNTSLPLDTC